MLVQPGLCRTWSETRTLVFSRRGSYIFSFDLLASSCIYVGWHVPDLVSLRTGFNRRGPYGSRRDNELRPTKTFLLAKHLSKHVQSATNSPGTIVTEQAEPGQQAHPVLPTYSEYILCDRNIGPEQASGKSENAKNTSRTSHKLTCTSVGQRVK